jgi:DNA-binding IscR family transcriptional regulator
MSNFLFHESLARRTNFSVDKKRRSLKEPEETLEIKDLYNSLMEEIKDEWRASLSNQTLADAVCAVGWLGN